MRSCRRDNDGRRNVRPAPHLNELNGEVVARAEEDACPFSIISGSSAATAAACEEEWAKKQSQSWSSLRTLKEASTSLFYWQVRDSGPFGSQQRRLLVANKKERRRKRRKEKKKQNIRESQRETFPLEK